MAQVWFKFRSSFFNPGPPSLHSAKLGKPSLRTPSQQNLGDWIKTDARTTTNSK